MPSDLRARKILLLLLAASASLLACDDTQEPVGPELFHLQILLTDPQGEPVPDLRVSAFNNVPEHLLQDSPGSPCAEVPASTKPLGVTNIWFCLPEPADVRILVFDGLDVLVREFPRWTLPAGAHSVAWDTGDQEGQPLPGGVYVFRFQARDPTTEEVLFEVSELSLHHLGAEDVLGFTGLDGRIETHDRRRFPSLLGFDSLQARDGEGNDLGKFQVLHSMTIVAVDTLTGASQCYTGQLVDAPQEVRLIWDPAVPSAPHSPPASPAVPPPGPAEIPVPLPGDWEGCAPQVVPNPYN